MQHSYCSGGTSKRLVGLVLDAHDLGPREREPGFDVEWERRPEFLVDHEIRPACSFHSLDKACKFNVVAGQQAEI